jgi:type 1 fimbria pilin
MVSNVSAAQVITYDINVDVTVDVPPCDLVVNDNKDISFDDVRQDRLERGESVSVPFRLAFSDHCPPRQMSAVEVVFTASGAGGDALFIPVKDKGVSLWLQQKDGTPVRWNGREKIDLNSDLKAVDMAVVLTRGEGNVRSGPFQASFNASIRYD